jgi:hypothetical protein
MRSIMSVRLPNGFDGAVGKGIAHLAQGRRAVARLWLPLGQRPVVRREVALALAPATPE